MDPTRMTYVFGPAFAMLAARQQSADGQTKEDHQKGSLTKVNMAGRACG